MNVVMGDEGVNNRAALPSDDEEDAETRTSGDEYMSRAYTLIIDFFLTPAPTRLDPPRAWGRMLFQ